MQKINKLDRYRRAMPNFTFYQRKWSAHVDAAQYSLDLNLVSFTLYNFKKKTKQLIMLLRKTTGHIL
jgi:hypothetical protein